MAWEHLRPGSSPVDWCEGNYIISANIAEFVNTISNFLFLLLPPVLMYLFKEYGRFVTQGIHVLWALLIIVGLSSMYFHATLSLIGQLLDELAILWVFMAAYSLFCPKKYFPRFCKSNRRLFSILMFVSALTATGLSIWKPIVNAFVLMAMGVPTMVMLYKELKRCSFLGHFGNNPLRINFFLLSTALVPGMELILLATVVLLWKGKLFYHLCKGYQLNSALCQSEGENILKHYIFY